MFLRLVMLSLWRRGRRALLSGLAVALGAGTATAFLILVLGVGDRVMAELRAYGANIMVVPALERLAGPGQGSLREADVARIRDHFWRRAVIGAAPLLSLETEVDGEPRTVVGIWGRRELRDDLGESFAAGHATLTSGWEIEGEWPEAGTALVGARLRHRIGDPVRVAGRSLRVGGRVRTGGEEDDQVFVDLALAQELSGRPGEVSRILVSAVTTPETEAAELLSGRWRRDPRSLTPRELEQMVCTNTPLGVALSIEQTLTGAEARPLRQATEHEGRILARVRGAFLMLSLLAAAAAGLSVLAAATAAVVDRRREIGLLKALGATDGSVAGLFLLEGACVAVAGSIAGYGLGAGAATLISRQVFGRPMSGAPIVYVATLAVALLIVLAGTIAPLRSVLRLQPRQVLHEA